MPGVWVWVEGGDVKTQLLNLRLYGEREWAAGTLFGDAPPHTFPLDHPPTSSGHVDGLPIHRPGEALNAGVRADIPNGNAGRCP